MEIEGLDDRVAAGSGSTVLELDPIGGDVWGADQERLWNASEKPSPVPGEKLYEVAGELLGRRRLRAGRARRWVGAMWVTKAGADPRFDHLWGHRSVSLDPTSPTGLVCMWMTC